jgi:hypothetical protein
MNVIKVRFYHFSFLGKRMGKKQIKAMIDRQIQSTGLNVRFVFNLNEYSEMVFRLLC